MNDLVALIILGILCIGQAIERFFYAKEMNKQLGEATRAVMSRNISEFLAATTPTKKTKEQAPEAEDVDISMASDEEFDKAIRKM